MSDTGSDARQLLATLLHELRQPLSVVALAVDTTRLELEQGMPERALHRLDGIAATLERLARELSRARHLRADAPQAPGAARVSVNEAVGASLAAARPTLDAAGLEVALHLPGGSPVAACDGAALREALAGILEQLGDRHRARQAGPPAVIRPGAVTLEVAATPHSVEICLRAAPGGTLEPPRGLADPPAGKGPRDSLGLLLSREILRAMDAAVEWAERDGAASLCIRLPAAPPPA